MGMRTLPILLCSLLMLAPAYAQRAAQPTTPNFYVPYGVRDAPPAPLEEYSSSDAQLEQPYDIAYAAPAPQMRGHYPPMGRPGPRAHRGNYGMYGTQSGFADTGVLVALGIIATALLAAGIAGMQ